jgi:hypothetical protein
MKKLQRASVFLIFSLIVSCNGTMRKATTNDTSIEILYYKGIVHTGVSIRCGEITKPKTSFRKVDTVLTNKQQNTDIANLVKALRVIDDSIKYCDVRMQCKINYANGDTVQLCIGGYSHNCTIKDGRRMENNDSLVYLLRNYSGYYNYFSKEELTYFDELKRFGIPKDYKNLSRRNPDGSLKPQ